VSHAGEIAKTLRKKLGIPEPTDEEREKRRRRFESRHHAKVCGKCGGPIGDTVYISRYYSRGFFGGHSYHHFAVCDKCVPRSKRDTPPPPRPCETCGRSVSDRYQRSPRTFCSEHCSAAYYVRRQRLKRLAAREEIACASCGKRFVPKRKDTITCGAACRQRLHRLRHRNGS